MKTEKLPFESHNLRWFEQLQILLILGAELCIPFSKVSIKLFCIASVRAELFFIQREKMEVCNDEI